MSKGRSRRQGDSLGLMNNKHGPPKQPPTGCEFETIGRGCKKGFRTHFEDNSSVSQSANRSRKTIFKQMLKDRLPQRQPKPPASSSAFTKATTRKTRLEEEGLPDGTGRCGGRHAFQKMTGRPLPSTADPVPSSTATKGTTGTTGTTGVQTRGYLAREANQPRDHGGRKRIHGASRMDGEGLRVLADGRLFPVPFRPELCGHSFPTVTISEVSHAAQRSLNDWSSKTRPDGQQLGWVRVKGYQGPIAQGIRRHTEDAKGQGTK
ncbi:hypothetical protein PMIN07_008080 [Paraphaeosphaeria minitans]|uniref:Uncharacterized protein n=1 Tax=Paraphaeosphaeria minitans TaxID=565426 RepID=A0A9P6KS74_9PLEO|nr:hypothetical protein PMIN01_04350 [Paraphaeosphaeria minitans]